MAGYVESIKVGSGEAWPVRDADAQGKLTTINDTLTTMNESMGTMASEVETLKTDLETLSEQIENDTDDGNYLPLEGGTMTGPITMGGNKVTGLPTPTAGSDAATKTYVDDAFPYSTIVSVTAGENIAINITEGQAVSFTYVTNKTSSGDIFIKVNGSAPTNSNYIHSGIINGVCFAGGIVTYSGSMFPAQVTGVIRLLNGRVIVSTHDFRGNASGIGYSMNFWDNVSSVGSISFSEAGTLAFDYLGKGQLAVG